ncbi:MAG: hypothetical protein IT239_05775, partial [Bacteroidia bacterium]|nr:hypothetical protein [Bacteroidia bacterium]
MKKIKRILPIVIGSAIVVSSCNNGGEKKEEVSSTQTETVDTLAQDEQTFNYVLPSPVQIASIFYRAKLKFEDGLMNKPENSAKYNTETKRTLN